MLCQGPEQIEMRAAQGIVHAVTRCCQEPVHFLLRETLDREQYSDHVCGADEQWWLHRRRGSIGRRYCTDLENGFSRRISVPVIPLYRSGEEPAHAGWRPVRRQCQGCGERPPVPHVDIRPVELVVSFSGRFTPLATTAETANTGQCDDSRRGGGLRRDGPSDWGIFGQPETTECIVLTGGGALLRGFDKLLAEETRLPVRIAKDPLTCIVRGDGRLLDQLGQPDLEAMTVS